MYSIFTLSTLLPFFFHGCFPGEIIFDRTDSNLKSGDGEDTDKLLTYEEALEKAGGFISILQWIYKTLWVVFLPVSV